MIHVGKSPSCHKLGLGVREIRLAAGTGADVMVCGAGAAGPAPDVRHQPPGNSKPKNGIFQFTKQKLRYPQTTQDIYTYPTGVLREARREGLLGPTWPFVRATGIYTFFALKLPLFAVK